MMRSQADSEARYRSLLQKAVRRGNVDLVYTASAFLENLSFKQTDWYRTLTAVITFAECWPLGSELNFNRKYHSKVAALIKTAESQKIKDAGGLACMAYALSKGDATVYDGTPGDKDIKIIANAIQRPDDYWQWVSTQPATAQQSALIENAMRFRDVGLPGEQAVMQAAAYLANSGKIQPHPKSQPAAETFPYWVVFDRHTLAGKQALRDVARDLHMQLPQLEWASYFYEGSRTNESVSSIWWRRRCDWHFQKVGLRAEEAHLLWEPAKQQLIRALAGDGRRLQNELYRWKLSNLEQIETLKRQVDLFIEHFEAVQRDQKDLFD